MPFLSHEIKDEELFLKELLAVKFYIVDTQREGQIKTGAFVNLCCSCGKNLCGTRTYTRYKKIYVKDKESG